MAPKKRQTQEQQGNQPVQLQLFAPLILCFGCPFSPAFNRNIKQSMLYASEGTKFKRPVGH